MLNKWLSRGRILFLAALPIVMHYFIYTLRYLWYLDEAGYLLLVMIFLGGLAVILASWIFFPSKLVVMAGGGATYFLPPLLDGRNFVEVDLPFFVFIVINLAFYIVVTQAILGKKIRGTHELGNK